MAAHQPLSDDGGTKIKHRGLERLLRVPDRVEWCKSSIEHITISVENSGADYTKMFDDRAIKCNDMYSNDYDVPLMTALMKSRISELKSMHEACLSKTHSLSDCKCDIRYITPEMEKCRDDYNSKFCGIATKYDATWSVYKSISCMTHLAKSRFSEMKMRHMWGLQINEHASAICNAADTASVATSSVHMRGPWRKHLKIALAGIEAAWSICHKLQFQVSDLEYLVYDCDT
jgi:hypothetical protein